MLTDTVKMPNGVHVAPVWPDVSRRTNSGGIVPLTSNYSYFHNGRGGFCTLFPTFIGDFILL